ncbi:MAG: hypothetical protein ONB23_02205 [candidate division KSB1 bacterium]|nr:hypothetical protein [candidate division KSB1 bacterium]
MKVCRSCPSLHDGRRWVVDRKRWEELREQGVEEVLCEACRRIRDRVVGGIVYAEGPVLEERRDEILRMLRREEEIESSRNHLCRILEIREEGRRWTITTINQWMALHIAKQLRKSFRGRLEVARDPAGRGGRGTRGREEVVVRWIQA